MTARPLAMVAPSRRCPPSRPSRAMAQDCPPRRAVSRRARRWICSTLQSRPWRPTTMLDSFLWPPTVKPSTVAARRRPSSPTSPAALSTLPLESRLRLAHRRSSRLSAIAAKKTRGSQRHMKCRRDAGTRTRSGSAISSTAPRLRPPPARLASSRVPTPRPFGQSAPSQQKTTQLRPPRPPPSCQGPLPDQRQPFPRRYSR